jgi:hypothetical protein
MMNERIENLLKQSMVTVNSHGAFGEPERHEEVDLEKFAELIVKECAKQAALFSVNNNRIHPDVDPATQMSDRLRLVYHGTCQAVAWDIKEHFGVE